MTNVKQVYRALCLWDKQQRVNVPHRKAHAGNSEFLCLVKLSWIRASTEPEASTLCSSSGVCCKCQLGSWHLRFHASRQIVFPPPTTPPVKVTRSRSHHLPGPDLLSLSGERSPEQSASQTHGRQTSRLAIGQTVNLDLWLVVAAARLHPEGRLSWAVFCLVVFWLYF